ncbi:hypothetical protein A2U01_0040973, partial [Trifolium medium]|nr:hypothetical protein [Trifolium medium]
VERHIGFRRQIRTHRYSWDGFRFCEQGVDGDKIGRSVSRAARFRGEGGKPRQNALSQNQCWHGEDGSDGGSGYKRFTTFYFTNFPEHIQQFHFRKAFEVCGIMENVFVAPKRNVNDHRYGFVRYSKLHALIVRLGKERRLKVGEAFVDEGAMDMGATVGRNRVGNNGEGEKSVRRLEGRVENVGCQEA